VLQSVAGDGDDQVEGGEAPGGGRTAIGDEVGMELDQVVGELLPEGARIEDEEAPIDRVRAGHLTPSRG
jgi:hypothetical protein